MSSNKTHNVNDILSRLKNALGIKNDAVLARHLGIKPSTISSWKARESIDYDLIFAYCKGLNINWLLTGEGPMHIEEGKELGVAMDGLTQSLVRLFRSMNEESQRDVLKYVEDQTLLAELKAERKKLKDGG